MNALHYTLIGAGAVVAAGAIGAGIAVPYIHKLFKASFGRANLSNDGQNAFLDGLLEKGYDEQVKIVRQGWDKLANTPHEKVYITSHDGHRLCAKLYAPQDPKATVILVHGYHSKGDMDFGSVFEFYEKQGIAMLIIYQRAHGESEGNYLTFGAKERFDIRDWCRFLVARYGEEHSIILDGVSMGCSTVLLASCLPDIPPQVKAVIGDCGYASAKDQIKQVVRDNFHLPPMLIYPVASLLCKLYGGAFLGEAEVHRELQKSKIPTLFAHGAGDDFVLPHNSQRNYDACASAYKRLCIFERSPHGLSYLDHKEAYEKEILALLRYAGILE